MDQEQKNRVINALVNFIEHTAEEKTTSDMAISVLPEVVMALVKLVYGY